MPPALAWQVLTDFERMDTFVPNLADSRIVASDGTSGSRSCSTASPASGR